MKREYIKPVCFPFEVENIIMECNSEDEVTYNIGAKENEDFFFDDVPFGSLWDDDPVEDPFAIGD
jgi:hypothetical protein